MAVAVPGATWLQTYGGRIRLQTSKQTYGGCTRSKQTYGGCRRMAVADRLQHEKPDTTKQENTQTSKQTYGGRIRLQSGCRYFAARLQSYGGRMAVVWRSYQVAVWLHLQTDVWRSYGGRIRLQTVAAINRPPNRRMAVVWRLHLFGSGCSRMEVAAYQVADLQTDVWRS